jgi:phosphoglycolate phosphatase
MPDHSPTSRPNDIVVPGREGGTFHAPDIRDHEPNADRSRGERAPRTDALMTAHWRGRPLQAILWDLDGTLIDTADDIALALNRSFGDHGLPVVPPETVRTLIGRGSPILIARALALNELSVDDATREALFKHFVAHYEALQAGGESTAVAYAGAAEALRCLKGEGLRLACVTNKQHLLAVQSLQHAGLADYLDLVVGGDTCARRKPAPDPLLHACRSLDVAVEAALMVGDSLNDVLAAQAVPMPVVCVPYGYNEGNDPRDLACDGRVERLDELPALLGVARNGASPDSGVG